MSDGTLLEKYQVAIRLRNFDVTYTCCCGEVRKLPSLVWRCQMYFLEADREAIITCSPSLTF